MIGLFLKGIVIGFAIAAPVGPIAVLCAQRTLVEGRPIGLASGLGAATADAVYGAIAAFGLAAISGLLLSHQLWLRIGGGIVLCLLGLNTFFARGLKQVGRTDVNSLAAAYGTTFLLTLTNPMTILALVAIFAGLELAAVVGDEVTAVVLVLGVFLGSSLWWTILSGGVALIRRQVDEGAIRWANRAAGIVIVGFGVALIFGVFGLISARA